MKYQEVKLSGGTVVMVDFDKRMDTCKKCGVKMRWGLTLKGNAIPISATKDLSGFQTHFVDCKYAGDFRKKNNIQNRINEEEKNQNLLNSF